MTENLFRSAVLAGLFLAVGPAEAQPLASRSWSELECLYRTAGVARVPLGYHDGEAVYDSDRPLSGVRSGVTNRVWHGKHFGVGTMTNQWAGVKALKADVYCGTSWLDGRPSVILDYRDTSFVWRNVRDEIREVSPGVYVGIMYEEKKGCRKIKAFFILEAACR